jgi:hypothetical protein
MYPSQTAAVLPTLPLLRRAQAAIAALVASVVLAGCGAGGAQTVVNPAPSAPGTQVQNYNGPAPASGDVQAFKVAFWDNVQPQNRCGSCHVQGNQSPMFARGDDINLAYQEAQTVVTLSDPASSKIVAKVGGGHHCWLASNSACADTMTTWIKNWAGSAGIGASTGQVQLVAPPIVAAGASRTFPTSSSAFASTVYPLLTQYCSRCHSPSAVTPQSPYFAQANVDAAYAAAQSKINLDTPELSRFYVRLKTEFHNCWGGNCDAAAATMLAAIQAFQAQVQPTQVDPSLVLSKALTLYDGTVASGGARYENGLIAKFEFKTGTGTVAYDTSGVEPALNLNMSGDVTWVGGWGVQVKNKGKLQGTTTGSKKIHDKVLAAGEYTIEAWLAPDNVMQTMAYAVSYSGGTTARNFTLAQTQYNWDFMQRSTKSDANGLPELSTPTAQKVVQATLQHVVLTYDPVNGRRTYVNGQLVASGDPQAGGALNQWDDTFALVLGNEVSGDRPWSGVIRFVAVYNRAFTAQQIQTNFDAGIGERYYLLFNVEGLTGLSKAYVLFMVSQYDSYSYLFTKPAFLSLDPNVQPGGLILKGMRIGINGREARVGQAYAPLDLTLDNSGYNSTTGYPLSAVGTVIALEKGPAYDQFFLTFDQLGSQTYVRTEPTPLAPTPTDQPRPSDVGVRTFERVSASLSATTGVPSTQSAVAALYQNLQQALPTTDNLQGFVASHQTAVAQLAIQYCDAAVNAPNASANFGGINLGASPAQAFTSSARTALAQALTARFLNASSGDLATQPSTAAVTTEVNHLIDTLMANPSATTPNIVKATCAAVAGSAGMLVQ